LRYFASAITCLAFTLVAACSAMVEDVASVAVHSASDYNPHAPSIEVLPLEEALEQAPWLTAGAYKVTALKEGNQIDTAVLDALEFSHSAGELTIGLNRALTSAAVYVSYDATTTTYQATEAEREGAISFAAKIRPGLVGVGVTAVHDGKLSTRLSLATLRFAAGADTAVVKRTEITLIPRNSVPDLVATDNVNSTATLSWTERHNGDYNNDSVVSIADITPLGSKLGADTDDGIGIDAEEIVIDGDENGLLTISDLTPLGAALTDHITGYNVYRTAIAGLGDNPDPTNAGIWTKVENDANPDGPSAPRQWNNQKTRLQYSFIDDCGNGTFAWYVAATSDPGDPNEPIGPASNVAKQLVTPAGPPPAGLSFEIVAPETEFQSVNDEFYLAVKITGVSELFSANVRFEYDSSVLEFIEGVSAYNDGNDHPNFLDPPLFVTVDDVDAAATPYVLLGFNATQTQGIPTKSGDGYLGYFKFRVTSAGDLIYPQAFKFPQATNFIYLWGETYGESVATPALGSPQLLNLAP
jgi:hypothetical protein